MTQLDSVLGIFPVWSWLYLKIIFKLPIFLKFFLSNLKPSRDSCVRLPISGGKSRSLLCCKSNDESCLHSPETMENWNLFWGSNSTHQFLQGDALTDCSYSRRLQEILNVQLLLKKGIKCSESKRQLVKEALSKRWSDLFSYYKTIYNMIRHKIKLQANFPPNP